MPRLSNIQITDLVARNARPRGRRYEIRDSLLRGFMLRVNPTGTKAWYVQLDRNHKRKIADAGLLTAAVARYRAKDVLVRQSISSGKPLKMAGKQTLGSFLTGRYARFKAQSSKYSSRDIKRLCTALGSLTKERLEHVGLSKLERWKLKRLRQVSPATVNRELSMLRNALDQACRWNMLADNPAGQIRLRISHQARKPRVLNPAERERLSQVLNGRNDRLSSMVQIALNTGLKRNELFSLRWKDIYFGPNPSIIIEKSGNFQNKNRRIPLNNAAVQVLSHWESARNKRGYLVFPGPGGGQLKSVNTAWKRLIEEAQIRKFCLQDCRDDFAIRLVRAGIPLTQVRDLLGHSTIALTEKYAVFAPAQLASAVASLNPP
jgi:integrase